MAKVIIKDLKKTFDREEIFSHLNLEIDHGEFLVIVGPSGCGKSTLLRSIAGLEKVDQGEIIIGNRSCTHLIPQKRNLSMVFQNYALYPHMNVFENIAYGLKVRKIPKSQIRKKVDWAASVLNLTELLERKPAQLSGGQRQRVAIGRSMVGEPKVFLFDEPLSNLDARLRIQMRYEIKSLHQTLKNTMIYVTHDQVEAMTMADRVAVMHLGRIQQIDVPLKLYDQPKNIFVAGFIGSPSMNLIEAVGSLEKNQTLIKINSRFQLPYHFTTLKPESNVILGIRPEHLKLVGPDQGWETEVRLVEQTGSHTNLYLNLGEKIINLVTSKRISPAIGEKIFISPEIDQIHLFDLDSGRNLRFS